MYLTSGFTIHVKIYESKQEISEQNMVLSNIFIYVVHTWNDLAERLINQHPLYIYMLQCININTIHNKNTKSDGLLCSVDNIYGLPYIT